MQPMSAARFKLLMLLLRGVCCNGHSSAPSKFYFVLQLYVNHMYNKSELVGILFTQSNNIGPKSLISFFKVVF